MVKSKVTNNNVPATEGITYMGSKLKLLPHILSCCSELKVSTVLDGFSGTTRVSQALAKSGYSVVSNDIAEWSEVLAKCYLLNTYPQSHYEGMFNHFNNLAPVDGWFTDNYGGDPAVDTKKPFQLKNTRKLDAIREEIDNLALSDIERSVALTGLINALDSVSNSLGHFSSYLAKWYPRSFKDLRMVVPCLTSYDKPHRVLRGDILSLPEDVEVDLAYLDPPYGSTNKKAPSSRVRYASYYHIWKTIVLNDKPPVFGKASRREDSRDSVSPSAFENYRDDPNGVPVFLKVIEDTVKFVNSRYVLLSYSSGGRVTRQDMVDMLSNCGSSVNVMEIDHSKNAMSYMSWTNQWVSDDTGHKEYLFLLDKS